MKLDEIDFSGNRFPHSENPGITYAAKGGDLAVILVGKTKYLGVGITASGKEYDVSFVRSDLGFAGMYDQELRDKIKQAGEEIVRQNEIFEIGARPKVLVIGPNLMVTPAPGVTVVCVEDKQPTF